MAQPDLVFRMATLRTCIQGLKLLHEAYPQSINLYLSLDAARAAEQEFKEQLLGASDASQRPREDPYVGVEAARRGETNVVRALGEHERIVP